MLVAAKHLDILQEKLPALHSFTGGQSEPQKTYLKQQIVDVEARISNLLEEIQSIRCDMIENKL